MSVAQLVRYLAALAFSMFIAWTGWVISDLLGVPMWLGVAVWMSTFVYLYLEYVQSLNDRLARLSKKAAEEARAAAADGPEDAAPQPAATAAAGAEAAEGER